MSKIAVVVSDFNKLVTDKLLEGVLNESKYYPHLFSLLRVFRVPGSIELIFSSNQIARSNFFQGIIVLGSVIKGETDHYKYVCQQVSQGIQNIIINNNIPIIFGVLTTHNLEQALYRVKGNSVKTHSGHYYFKALMDMIKFKQDLSLLKK